MRHGDAAGSIDGGPPPARQEPKPMPRPVSEELLRLLLETMQAQLVEQRRTNELLAGFAKARAAAASSSAKPPASTGGGGEVAPDRDLDGAHGDPTVKFSPKKWLENGGKDYAGWKYSECPPDFLDALADLKDWQADRPKAGDDGAKFARFNRADASRARGWAERARRNGAAGGNSGPRPVPPQEDEMIP